MSHRKNVPIYQVANITSKPIDVNSLSDATLVLDDGTEFKIHRLLLASASRVLRAVFAYDDNESKIFKLGQVSSDGMSHILDWIYSRQLSVYNSHLLQLILVDAMYLDCRELISACVNLLKRSLKSNNVVGHYTFSKTYGVLQLGVKCKELIEYNYEEVAGERDFLSLPLEDLEELLQSDRLNAEETTIWLSVMRWADCDLTSRVVHLPMLIRNVRTSLLPNRWANGANDISNSKEPQRQLETARKALKQLQAEKMFYRLHCNSVSGDPTEKRLPADVVLAFGGCLGNGAVSTLESYDVRTDQWLSHKNDYRRMAYLATTAIGTKVFLIGGTTLQNGIQILPSLSGFDVDSGKYAELNRMHESRCQVSVATLDNQYIFAMGGFNGSTYLRSVEYFDIRTNQWRWAASMKHRRSDAGGVAANGMIYVLGGSDGDKQHRSAEVYNPRTKKWTMLNAMPNRRSGLAVVSDGSFIYALGGTEDNKTLASCLRFDTNVEEWLPMKPMLEPRSNFSAVIVDQGILVAGGNTGTSSTASAEFYSFETKNWQRRSPMIFPRSAFSMCTIKGPLPKEIVERFACPVRKK